MQQQQHWRRGPCWHHPAASLPVLELFTTSLGKQPARAAASLATMHVNPSPAHPVQKPANTQSIQGSTQDGFAVKLGKMTQQG
mmetsp:Transcript_19791/g.38031  ORF Transcript_19791/g.38031 Transcript_19791/m.38031 type:complete len:83 (+) Transcript_19791:88-336(+)